MDRRNSNSREHARKALDIINKLKTKYPFGIKDVSVIQQESRAWVERCLQILRENIKHIWFPKGKPEWFEPLRCSRNDNTHLTQFATNEEFKAVCLVFENIKNIEDDLRTVIPQQKTESKAKRKFENFASPALGSISDRKQLVDAIEDKINPVEPKEIKIEFPKNSYAQLAEKILSEILEYGNVKDYVLTHEGFSENIQTDILDWLQKTNATLEKENPFFEEAVFIEQVKKLSAQELALDISNDKSKIKYHYNQLPSVSDLKHGNIEPSTLDFDFYSKAFSEQKNGRTIILQRQNIKKDGTAIKEKISWKSTEKLKTLYRHFIANMEKNLIERKNKWEMERIDALRKTFLEQLYQKIQNFMRLEKLLSPLIKSFGRLWDLSEHIFETSGFEILDKFAKLLEQDESLQELADLLGKQSRAQSIFEKELRGKVVIKAEWHPKSAYRGEINGLRYSNDVSAALPTELAILKNPAAKKLFQLKFAQKQLLSFDYQNDATESQEEVSVEKKEPKGPAIICVDTKGSMHGTPENIAKTIIFALAKIAVAEERKCYLIYFSTEIENFDLRDFKTGNALSKLVNFLRMSFNGRTDARQALKHSVEMLHQEAYKNADVLMISDSIMGALPDNLVKSIEAEKENGTNFYSLVIGSNENQETIKCFNRNWLYNTSDPHAQRHLIEQLHELKNRKIDKN